MTIDVKKIRVGDELTVTMGVREFTNSHIYVGSNKPEGGMGGWITSSEIATHTPKPRPIKIGDTVIFRGFPLARRKVIGLDGDSAWLLDLNNGERFVQPATAYEVVS